MLAQRLRFTIVALELLMLCSQTGDASWSCSAGSDELLEKHESLVCGDTNGNSTRQGAEQCGDDGRGCEVRGLDGDGGGGIGKEVEEEAVERGRWWWWRVLPGKGMELWVAVVVGG